MKNKALAVIAYIPFIGWLIAFLRYKSEEEKNSLVRYHLGQALGITIFGIAIVILIGVMFSLIPSLASIVSLAGLLPLIMLIYGIVSAFRESLSPVPGIGKLFENQFSFLN